MRRAFEVLPPVWSASRLRGAVSAELRPKAITATETLLLIGLGALAGAAVLLFDFSLKAPGHAILRGIFPTALGLALVPRRGAGSIMGAGSLAFIGAAMIAGFGKGLGSTSSVVLIGPCLDLALAWARNGRQVYVAMALAGASANLAAMVVQLGAKLAGIGGGGKGVAAWLPVALVSYPLFGLLAGFLAAAVWFRFGGRSGESE